MILFSSSSFGQDAQKKTDTFSEQNLPEKSAKAVEVSPTLPTAPTVTSKVRSALADILMNKKASSLMFDDEENSDIDRAIDSLKNNQVYSPEGTAASEEGGKNLNEEDQKKKSEADKLKKEAEEKEKENEKSYIYLASIIYFTPNDWAVWINQQKITSENNQKDRELYLKSVQKDRVKILWKLSISKWKILSGRKSEEFAPKINKDNQVEVEFELRTNQTFILSTANIVEGRAVIALLKQREDEKKAEKEGKSKVVEKSAEIKKVE